MNKLYVTFKDGKTLEFECFTKADRKRIIAKLEANPYLAEIERWSRTAQDGGTLEEGPL